MKVRIGDSISTLYRKIVENHSTLEVRGYRALTVREKEEILSETFERRFKAFWNSRKRSTIFKRENLEETEKATKIEKTFKLISNKLGDHYTAVLVFYFDICEDVFNIEISSVTMCSSPSDNAVYKQILIKELSEVKERLEKNYTQRMFLKDFFDTLHVHRLSIVTGYEASLMYDIYRRARRYYPLFRNLYYTDQMEIMHKGYLHAVAKMHYAHDIYGFAKATFEQMDAEGLLKELDNGKLKKLVYERRITRRNPDIYSEIWQKNYLVYATYEYEAKTGDKIRISYHPSDLWLYLAQL